MDRNSNSDIEVEPYEEIVRNLEASATQIPWMPDHSTPRPDLPSRPVCEHIFSNGRDELENAHSTVLSTSVPWPALRHELAWEKRAAVVSDQNGRVSVSTHGHERNFSTLAPNVGPRLSGQSLEDRRTVVTDERDLRKAPGLLMLDAGTECLSSTTNSLTREICQ